MPTKRENGNDFPAGAFAYVPDAANPSTWKLRLWEDPTKKETTRQVGMAVAALGKGFRGNRVQIPADDRAKVVARVRAAWKKVNANGDGADMPDAIAATERFRGLLQFRTYKRDRAGRFGRTGAAGSSSGGSSPAHPSAGADDHTDARQVLHGLREGQKHASKAMQARGKGDKNQFLKSAAGEGAGYKTGRKGLSGATQRGHDRSSAHASTVDASAIAGDLGMRVKMLKAAKKETPTGHPAHVHIDKATDHFTSAHKAAQRIHKRRRSEHQSFPKAASEPELRIHYYDDMMAAPSGMPAGPKLLKSNENVNYRNAGDVGTRCGVCRFYEGGSCRLVEGTISADDTCDLFMERPTFAEGDNGPDADDLSKLVAAVCDEAGIDPESADATSFASLLRGGTSLSAASEMRSFAGNTGNVRTLITTFGKWAGGSHKTCTSKLAAKGFKDVNALCAWLKDRWSHSTMWRGDDNRKKATEMIEPGRVSMALGRFSEPPQWIPYLPVPGVYTHPRYGKVVVSRERNERFVENFSKQVYQDRLPIDAEHETKLSGAFAWVTGLRLNPNDESVEAQVQWTDRGRKMIEQDRFRYFSPEWLETWTDPASGQVYRDIATGGALTTRPFFKPGSLRPLVASEDELFVLENVGVTDEGRQVGSLVPLSFSEEDPDAVDDPDEEDNGINPADLDDEDDAEDVDDTAEFEEEDTAVPPENTEDVTVVEMSEQMLRRFDEMEASLRTMTEQRDTLQATVDRQQGTLDSMAQESRRRRFTDLVMGRGEGGDGLTWFGDIQVHVGQLEFLASAAGEESEQFRSYVETNRASAAQLRDNRLFSTIGSGGDNYSPSTAWGKIEAKAKALMTSSNGLSFDQAVEQAQSENPQLYAEYLAENSNSGPRQF
jgi:hypothetical protein